MAVAAPVLYWEKKRTRHLWSMVISGFVLVLAMGATGFLLHKEIQSIGLSAAVRKTTAVQPSAVEAAKLPAKPVEPVQNLAVPNGMATTVGDAIEVAASWRLGSVILLATLCFWALRLLVRIFLSNMHLENDAAERVTMVRTYLALLRKGRLPKDEDLSLVLAALFRPSGDGIIKDEGMPPNLLDALSRQMKS